MTKLERYITLYNTQISRILKPIFKTIWELWLITLKFHSILKRFKVTKTLPCLNTQFSQLLKRKKIYPPKKQLYNTQISQHPKTRSSPHGRRRRLYNTQISQHPKTSKSGCCALFSVPNRLF